MSKKTAPRRDAKPSAKSAAKTARRIRPTPRPAKASGASKLDQVITALRAPKGATIAALMKLTGWQAHSVRGAMSGALKKTRGLSIVSEKRDDERVYRIEA
jgi:hypothetical protein